MGRSCGENGRMKTGIERMPRKWMGNGGDEDRCCDGRTSLRYTWIEWEKNVEQQQHI